MTTLQFDDGPFAALSLDVVSVTGDEAVNELFQFTVVFLVHEATVQDALTGGSHGAEHTLLRNVARLTLGEGPSSFTRFAVVSSARYEGAVEREGGPFARFRVELSPTAWLLTQRRRSRVFQRMFSHEIISKVLGDVGARHRWALGNKYPRRLYCIQYDETDWDFVSRLLAEEGMFFFFDHVTDFTLPGAAAAAEKSTWDKIMDTAVPALAGVGKAAQKIGEIAEIGAISMGGQLAQVIADVMTPVPEDEELRPAEAVPPGAGGPPGPGDVLVFGDMPAHYEHAFREDGTDHHLTLTRRGERNLLGDSYALWTFAATGAVRPDRVENRDYDFRRPLLLLRSVHPAEARAVAPADGFEVYFHHGEYERPDVAGENSALQLEQHRRRALVHQGQSNCPRVLPGHLLTVENASPEPIAVGEYAVLRVVHEVVNQRWSPTHAADGGQVDALARGCAAAIREALRGDERVSDAELSAVIRTAVDNSGESVVPYRNRAEFVHADFPARPPRPVRVMRNVVETATVVGPRGEAIHTDRYGRIKIQFHWDRDNQWDDLSSCWVRVTQPWSGAGFGFQFIPRVGMEVLVAFVGGDPDRPVVIGTLYNGTHEPPELLPERKSRSAIRSQTVRTDETDQSGAGFNEIAFEDAAGVERLVFHAQKDLEEVVNDSHQTSVRGEQVLVVGGNQSVGVGHSQRVGVTDSQVLQVGGAQFDNVGGSRTARVAGHETRLVDGSVFERIGGSLGEAVQGDAVRAVHGTQATSVHGDVRLSVGGTGDDPQEPHVAVSYVHGAALVTTHMMLVTAKKLLGDSAITYGIGLQCDESSLEIDKDNIVLKAKNITIHATESLTVIGKDAMLKLDGSGTRLDSNPITLTTNHGASLQLKDNKAKLFGSQILLQPATTSAQNDSQDTSTDPPNVHIKFTHGVLGPDETLMKDVPYRVLIGEDVKEGTLDGNGTLHVLVRPTIKTLQVQLFPWRVSGFEKLYPKEQGPLEYLVHVEDHLPANNTLPGARVVLRNVGFEPTMDLNSATVEPGTADALRTFQRWNKLRPTGHFDTRTADKLPGYEG